MANDNTLQYIQLDYESHRNALLQRVRSRWPTVWNDFLAGSFGRLIVDIVAWSTATIAYVIHRMVAENFLPTMTLRESAVRLGALVGYKLRQPGAATVQCEASLAAAQGTNVKLSAGTAVSASNLGQGIIFELSEDYVIEAGKLSPERLVLRVSPTATGVTVLSSSFTVTDGSLYADLADTTTDLTAFVAVGQSFKMIGSSTYYQIQAIEAAPDSSSNNRLVLDRVWSGSTGSIEADILERRVTMAHGQTFVENSVAPSVETPGFQLRLSRTPVIEGSVDVYIDGVLWTEVDAIPIAGATDLAYEVRTAPDGVTLVLFGNGTFGQMVPASATLKIQYRVGGGVIGNVAAGSISATVIAVAINGSGVATGAQVSVQLTNITSTGQGGTEKESLAEARSGIPSFIRANDRCVTAEDYGTLAARYSDPLYGQVRYARALAREGNSLLEGNVIFLYAWTTGPGGGLVPLGTSLKGALQRFLQTKAIGTDFVTVLDGTSRPAPISFRFKTISGVDIAATQAALQNQVSAIVTATRPGQAITFSDMVASLDGQSGVDSIDMASPVSDLFPGSPTEVFTVPETDYQYTVGLSQSGTLIYSGYSPVVPIKPWSFKAYLNDQELLVLPDTVSGRARLVGPGLADYQVGSLADRPAAASWNQNGYYYAADQSQLYQSNGSAWVTATNGGSYVELQSGRIQLATTEANPGLTLELVPAHGYDSIRTVNVYIGYVGTNTLAKRREIRAAIQAWSENLQVGVAMFSQPQRSAAGQVLLDTSRSNVRDVVFQVAGVTDVTRVALDSPSNASQRLDPSASELLRIGVISINNQLD